ncbi:MAG: LysR family transcriptional regulator [Alteromonadaceae bacterium]|nr:LysR family transcriptional regulator [Alteromonadaceae bacterium]MBB21032.1 LysR family transcriptional regulator [Rickettsiales bacterium]
MNQLNYQHLYYFYVTATEGSIIKAASVLHLTPQTISEQIRTLEAYFGFDLFDRVGKRLQLNSQGQLTYNFAKNIFNMGNELLLSVRNQKQNQQHMLSIGVTDVLPKILAFEMFQRCLKAHPNVRLVCKEGDLNSLTAQLALSKVDGILSDQPLLNTSNVKAYNHLLARSGLSFFVAQDLAERFFDFPQCLDNQPFLLPGDKSAQKLSILAWFAKHNINPQIAAEFDDGALMKLFAQRGYGVFCAPTSAEHHIEKQYKVRVIGRTDLITEHLYLISPERKVTNPLLSPLVIKGAAR